MKQLHPATETPGRLLDVADLVAAYEHPTGPDGGWYLRTNFVSTIDGTSQGADGRAGSINTPSDHLVFAVLRAVSDVVLVGATTVRTEGYRAIDLQPWQHDVRTQLGLQPYPTLAVVSGSLDLDPAMATADGTEGGPVMIITDRRHSAARLEVFRGTGIELMIMDQVTWPEVLTCLAARGLRRILSEGGTQLHGDLIAAGLVDELCLTISPLTVAGPGLRITSGPLIDPPRTYELTGLLLADDQTLFTRYRPTERHAVVDSPQGTQ